MNKTKIEWCDSTWNPVTGCRHGCPYCYAQRIAKRYGGWTTSGKKTTDNFFKDPPELQGPLLLKRNDGKVVNAPYPFGFTPTFHRYRLDEPSKKTKGQTIFVCSMADLFGRWVPTRWIVEVLDACRKGYASLQGAQEDYLRLKELSDTANGELTGRAKITFERYAQGRFFRQIVARANQRLYQMTNGRFELAMQESAQNNRGKTGLDLDVIDHYTGKRRSVKTLSGGEAFQASLSLALGLSDVVQRRSGGMQLDALFLDEGFGTLDEEALRQAIGTLQRLADGQKMVGIISHVAELKEAIGRKIIVTATAQGSTLEIQA